MIGTSKPTEWANSTIELAVATPSTVEVAPSTAFSIEPLRPSVSPNERFLESEDPQVARRSPTPASPTKVSGFAPRAIPSLVNSFNPRVMTSA